MTETMTAPRYLKLGQNLKRLLFERNMKPIDLAREVNLPQPTIHRLVSGKSTRPYKSSLKPIAEFFSVSVDELLGETPAIDNVWGRTTDKIIRHIPIIDWDQLNNLKTMHQQAQKEVITTGLLSEKSFATIMPDSSMEPLFAKNTLLIFDPLQTAKDRSYVLVKSHENHLHLFRQLLTDGNNNYLKPLNPDLSLFMMRALHKEDKLVGVLVESRNQFLATDQHEFSGEK